MVGYVHRVLIPDRHRLPGNTQIFANATRQFHQNCLKVARQFSIEGSSGFAGVEELAWTSLLQPVKIVNYPGDAGGLARSRSQAALVNSLERA